MVADAFSHVSAWVFDLDNTLYPPEARLFDQIEVRMTAWVSETLGVTEPEADRLRSHYWAKYGTTLAGLMEEHGVDPPAPPYLTHVHEIDMSHLEKDVDLRAHITDLPADASSIPTGPNPTPVGFLTHGGAWASCLTRFTAWNTRGGFVRNRNALPLKPCLARTGWTPPLQPCSKMTRAIWPRPPTRWACARCMSPPPKLPPPPITSTTTPMT